MPAPATPHTRLPHAAPTLLLLLTALATTLACRHLPPCHTTFPWDSLTILRHMAPAHTCQHQHTLFPDTLLHNNQPQQAADIATHILHNLFHVLNSHTVPQHWDRHARHRLLNNLHHRSQQLHQLQQCLTRNATLLQQQQQGPRNATRTINKHFRHIHHFLRTHNHSACAWDHLRLQAHASFHRLHNLTRTICA